MKNWKFMLGIVMASCLPFVASASLNLVVNGSFDNTGSTYSATYYNNSEGAMILTPGSTTIPGWTVQTGDLDWDQSGAFGLSAQGSSKYFLDLTDDEVNAPAGISQTITTTPGAKYQVSFWLGSSSVYNPGTTQPFITVNINGNPVQSFDGIGSQAPAQNYWQQYAMDFTASSSSTTLLLQGGNIGIGHNEYIGLDNVSVTAVPEPTTLISGVLMLLPFGASTLRILRRKQAGQQF
jgi:hypothetical protein